MTNLAKLTKAQLIAQIEDLRHEFLTLQVESQDTIEDLRTKYSDLSIGYDQLLHDISVLEIEAKDAEAAALILPRLSVTVALTVVVPAVCRASVVNSASVKVEPLAVARYGAIGEPYAGAPVILTWSLERPRTREP